MRTEEKWIIREQDPETVERIRRQFGLSDPVARLLCNRGLTKPEQIQTFLRSDLYENLHDPMLLNDMAQAVARIRKAIADKETITIYGDYDVDGITSTVILYQYLSRQTDRIRYYIPSRLKEGYGMNREALEAIRADGTSLLITVDTGTTAMEEIRHAKELGLDVVVTDHHECMDDLPDCPVVNPKRKDSTYPFPDLAGVGVVFKLICALTGDAQDAFRRYGGITAIGTIADIMPLMDENRSIVHYGLKQLEKEHPAGIDFLLKESGADTGIIDTNVIAYQIAPRMNAAGRINDCRLSVDLLLETDPQKAEALAKRLCECNAERKEKEQQVVRDIDRILEKTPLENKIMVYASEHWHNGVIGIAASRLTERYSRPCVLICFEGDNAKGSARSVKGVNLFELIGNASRFLENFGGHEMAVGLTLKRENYEKFLQDITEYANRTIPEEALIPSLEAEFEVGKEAFSLQFVRDVSALEPFGNANPYPCVAACGLNVCGVTAVGGGKHTRLTLEKDGVRFTAMCFGMTPESLDFAEEDQIDILCTITEKDFRGKPYLNVSVRSARLSGFYAQTEERKHYEEYRNAGVPLPEKAKINRTLMVALYKYLTAETLRRADEQVPLRFTTVFRALRDRYGKTINACQLQLCLDALEELGLLRRFSPDQTTGVLYRNRGKVDLTTVHDWDQISCTEKE